MIRKVTAANGTSAGKVSSRQWRNGARPKLRPISSSSLSRASKPSRRLTKANGSNTATMVNTTVVLDTPNQITASKVQPMPENALKNGLRRRWIKAALQPQECAAKAMAAPNTNEMAMAEPMCMSVTAR